MKKQIFRETINVTILCLICVYIFFFSKTPNDIYTTSSKYVMRTQLETFNMADNSVKPEGEKLCGGHQ